MHTTEPYATVHPLLARLPVAAGAVRLRAWRTSDVDDSLVCRSDPEVARCPGLAAHRSQPCNDGLLVPLGMTRLHDITDVCNAASLRLLSRLGFMQTLREDVVFRGEASTEVTLERCL